MKQIGICGTFDVQNYGDLLFPFLAEAELSRRLGPITLHRFSYFDKAPPDWPYHVMSVVELPKVAGGLDGMIIGGGGLIRFDKGVAPGYFPPTPDIHHPTGYWLTPALICLHAGCPVAWGAPGGDGVGAVPAWAAPLLRLAIGLSRYVAVRDNDARAMLAPFAGEQDIAVVPDTCFGLSRLLEPNHPSPALLNLRRLLQLTRPYIIVQATHGLDAFARLVAKHPARFAGYQFIALPVGPVLGDDAAILGNDYLDLVRLPDYPHPLLMAELIAGAAGVVGVSLHLAITAIAFGVPTFRPASASGGKYAVLSRHSNIHAFATDGEITPAWFEARLAQRAQGSEMSGISASLDRHWDKVALAFSPGREIPQRLSGLLWQQLPVLLEGTDRIAAPENVIAERDRRISILDALVIERDGQIVAVKASLDRMRAEVTKRNDWLRALLNSTSWKMTAPLRWVGRRALGARRSRILRLDRIEQEPLAMVPYEWAFVNGLFSPRSGRSLVREYPLENFKTVKGHDGEKGFEYEARALIHMNATTPSFPEDLSDAWRMLADDLLSPAYRKAMTNLTGRDLSNAPMEAYVCHYGPGAWLGPHLDLKDKIVTHVLYFNASWERENGGCLNILRSANMSDKFAEITPIVGNSSVVVRSEISWHSVSPVMNGCRSSRRSMNVIFYHPGAVSTMWPPGDNAPLHRYQEAAD